MPYEDLCAWKAASKRLPTAKLHLREDSVFGTTALYSLWAVWAMIYTDADVLHHVFVKEVASRQR